MPDSQQQTPEVEKPETVEFPRKLKQEIQATASEVIKELLKKKPNFRDEVDEIANTYSLEGLLGQPYVKKFVKSYTVLILDKYNRFIKPFISLHSGENLPAFILEIIFEDFFQYILYKCANDEGLDTKLFDNVWNSFEQDFFNNTLRIKYICRIKGLIRYGGGFPIGDITKDMGVELQYVDDPIDLRLLAWERDKSSWAYTYSKKIERSWIKLEKEIVVKDSENVATPFAEVVNQFQLITLIMRCISQGSAYFNDIRVFGMGNYGLSEIQHQCMRPVAENDFYQDIRESTIIRHPDDTFISTTLRRLTNTSYEDVLFADRNIILSKLHPHPADNSFTVTTLEFYLFSRTINLTFAFNSLVFDAGNRHNEKFRENYFPNLLHDYFGQDSAPLKDAIIACFSIRNKVAHGDYTHAKNILYAQSSSQANYEHKLTILETAIKRLILLALVNVSIKTTLESWYRGGDPTAPLSLVHPYKT